MAQATSNAAPVKALAVPRAPAPRIIPENGPLGLLEIPSLELRTALYPDTSEINLNRGAGLIRGMARPGEGGNLGLAAHRDGFFRPLERIAVGDAIEVRTPGSHYVYRVASIAIVDRADAALLRRTAEPSITLVTCYPFRFVGPAPKRFVVRGRLDSTRELLAPGSVFPGSIAAGQRTAAL
ncbi:MAG TPA: class D sortase [Steroidobacter sp.]|uniref:class D sortase n=1 Tax=Steroidobacter sp. TaxID=1978227 RepID=UPI002ED91514